MKEKTEEEKIEQGELDAYADQENNPATDDERKDYLKARYELIKNEYRTLQLQKWEADGSKNDQVSKACSESLSRNYRHRKFVVRTLRMMGEKVEDKFVPG